MNLHVIKHREAIELLNQLANINGISALCQVGFKIMLLLPWIV